MTATASSAIDYQDLVGTPYDRMNCWACARELFRRQGIAVPDVFNDKDQIQVRMDQAGVSALDWIASLFGAWRRVPEPVVGCALAFGDVEGQAVHIGILVEPGRFLHSTKKTGVVLVRLDRKPWPEKLVGAYVYQPD